jgi:hypothetical protein
MSSQVDPQNTRLYAYQQNSYRYLYTSPRILLAPALFLLAGGLLQYFAQKIRVSRKRLIFSLFEILFIRLNITMIVMQEKYHMQIDQILMLFFK